MEIEYGSNKLRKQLSTPIEIQKAFGNMAKKVCARLDEIIASPNLAILKSLPAPNCHALIGNKAGEWALNVSPNHRMIFEINHNPIPSLENGEIDETNVTKITLQRIEDYH